MNSKFLGILIYVASGIVTAISQLILKKAALLSKKKQGVLKYLDWKIIISYGMLFSTFFFNMFAMRYLPYKFTPVLSSLSYVFILLLGKVILHERIGKRRAIGIALIFLGMLIFYVG